MSVIKHNRTSGGIVLSIIVAMLGILLVAGVVVLYVAYPHRGQDVPAAPWLSDVMRKTVGAVPTIDRR